MAGVQWWQLGSSLLPLQQQPCREVEHDSWVQREDSSSHSCERQRKRSDKEKVVAAEPASSSSSAPWLHNHTDGPKVHLEGHSATLLQ